ncbi:VOC family protein [Streptomyces griseoincarnatus]
MCQLKVSVTMAPRPAGVGIEARDMRALARMGAEPRSVRPRHRRGVAHRPGPSGLRLRGPLRRTRILAPDPGEKPTAPRGRPPGGSGRRVRGFGAAPGRGAGRRSTDGPRRPGGLRDPRARTPRHPPRHGPAGRRGDRLRGPARDGGGLGEELDRTVHEVSDAYAPLRPSTASGPCPEFLRTPDSDTEPDRLCLCLCLCLCLPADDPAAEVARLRALGATPVGAGRGGPPGPVLAGPEGHAFRLVTSGRSS